MKVIDRYIAKTVIIDTLGVLIALIMLRSLFDFMEEGSNIGRGDYQLADAMYFIILQIPARIYEFFPVSALIGGLVGIGQLASHSELIVMRASGVSLKAISVAVLKGTISLMILVFLIGEFVSPVSSQLARQMQTSLISGGNLVKSPQGVWVKEDNNYVHVRIILPDGQLEGITRFQFSDQQLQATLFAQTGRYQDDGKWLLKGVQQTFITADSVSSTRADFMYWDTTLSPENLGVVSLKPEDLNLQGLQDYNNYLIENGLDARRYQLAFWKKILQPLAVAVMMFLALSFISGPLRTVTVGARVVMGILVGFFFNMLSKIFGPFSLVYDMPVILAASLPIILFGIIASVMLNKAQ